MQAYWAEPGERHLDGDEPSRRHSQDPQWIAHQSQHRPRDQPSVQCTNAASERRKCLFLLSVKPSNVSKLVRKACYKTKPRESSKLNKAWTCTVCARIRLKPNPWGS